MEKTDLTKVKIDTHYHGTQGGTLDRFLKPCFNNSKIFYGAIAYFSSSIFWLINKDILRFIKNGGYIEIICCEQLSAQDNKAIEDGYKKREDLINEKINKELEKLLNDEKLKTSTEILASLIKLKKLDIKIAIKKNNKGIYHTKICVFTDHNGNKCFFDGSLNLTGAALEHNHELTNTYCSWKEKDKDRCKSKQKLIDNLKENKEEEIDILDFPQAAKKKLIKERLPQKVKDVASLLQTYSETKKEKLEEKELIEKEKKLEKIDLRDYQKEFVENWEKNNYKGLMKFATGCGKTLTAISIIKKHIETKNNKVLIIVPDTVLLDQWYKELKQYIDLKLIMKCGGNNTKYKKDLNKFSSKETNTPFIYLAIDETARKDFFINEIQGGDHLLLVADEVHELGSNEGKKIFQIESGKRLGLSATPERYGDTSGTEAIFNYFDKIIKPEYELKDAIKNGWLVPYKYYAENVDLTAEEEDEYEDLTKKIKHEYHKTKNNSPDERKKYEQLIYRRANIIKKAKNKVRKTIEIINENYKKNKDQWWLIYCQDENDLNMLVRGFKIGLKKDIKYLEFHGHEDKKQRDINLEYFIKNGGLLISMKMLDQGVDIPQIDHAIVLASSQNPRQFIQRRGRVLRKSKSTGKDFSIIYDILALPSKNSGDDLLNIAYVELSRAVKFSKDAYNQDTVSNLIKLCTERRIDYNELMKYGEEYKKFN